MPNKAAAPKRTTPKQISHLRQSVLVRDEHTCRFCGFHSSKFMDMVARDSNPYHLNQENMVTACPFCRATLNAGTSGNEEMGQIIYLPQMTQAQLNWLVHAIALGHQIKGRTTSTSTVLLEELQQLSKVSESIWGEGISSPTALTGIFHSLSSQHFRHRNQLFYGLRFLPDLDQYKREIDYWYQTSYQKMTRDQFAKIYKQWFKK